MLLNRKISEIKECKDLQQLELLMSKLNYDCFGNEALSSNTITFEDSSKKSTCYKVNINGELGLILRFLTYLKFEGLIDQKPINSGKLTYFVELRLVLNDLKTIGINYVADIDSRVLDKLIVSLEKKNKAITAAAKIRKIKEWLLYANKHLPAFLNIEKHVFANSKEIKRFDLIYKKEASEQIVGSNKELYPLELFKKIMQQSFKDIKEYEEETLSVIDFWSTIKNEERHKRNAILFDYFRDSEKTFQIESFLNQQEKCLASKTKYTTSKKLLIGDSYTVVLNEIDRLETACINIILFFTGMRVSELILLQRFPTIENDEHLNLKRFVYKTASTEKGEPLLIPIPKIVETSLHILSKISSAKDDAREGDIVVGSARASSGKTNGNRVQQLISKYCKAHNINSSPSPHQFRHAMAFFISYGNSKDGVELAREFLGHSSYRMTLQYLGHYNPFFREAISEMQQEQSKEMVKLLVDDIKDGKKLYGAQGERIMQNVTFKGSYADTAADLLDKSLNGLIAKGKVVIIQSSVCMCIHDLTKEEEMACQRGLNIKTFIGEGPQPSRCEGGNCPNAVFREDNINALQREDIDPELYGRLMQNTIFADAGGFDNLPNRRIIKQYQKDQEAV